MPPACSEWKLLERCRTAWLWAAPAKLWILGTEVDPVLRQEAAWSQHHFAVADGPQLPGSRYRVCPSAVVQPMCCVPLRWDTPMCVHLRFASREMLQACLVACGRERRGKHSCPYTMHFLVAVVENNVKVTIKWNKWETFIMYFVFFIP